MRAELGFLNHCAVPFLNRAAANLCCYYVYVYIYKLEAFSNCIYLDIALSTNYDNLSKLTIDTMR